MALCFASPDGRRMWLVLDHESRTFIGSAIKDIAFYLRFMKTTFCLYHAALLFPFETNFFHVLFENMTF